MKVMSVVQGYFIFEVGGLQNCCKQFNQYYRGKKLLSRLLLKRMSFNGAWCFRHNYSCVEHFMHILRQHTPRRLPYSVRVCCSLTNVLLNLNQMKYLSNI